MVEAPRSSNWLCRRFLHNSERKSFALIKSEARCKSDRDQTPLLMKAILQIYRSVFRVTSCKYGCSAFLFIIRMITVKISQKSKVKSKNPISLTISEIIAPNFGNLLFKICYLYMYIHKSFSSRKRALRYMAAPPNPLEGPHTRRLWWVKFDDDWILMGVGKAGAFAVWAEPAWSLLWGWLGE